MAYRLLRDAKGTEWEVWEVHPTVTERRINRDRRHLPRATRDRRVMPDTRPGLIVELRRGWLVFRSATERRRVNPIPPDWESYTDGVLLELLEHTEPRPRSRRLIE